MADSAPGDAAMTSIPCTKGTRKLLRLFKAMNDLRTYDEAINTLLEIAGKTKRI